MLKRDGEKQIKLVTTTIEELMPKEHFLRDLDKHVDFTFIYDKVSHLYSNVGRASVDPVVLFKMVLLGFLYGIDSERKLEQEVRINIAFRWFLGLDLDGEVPDHSTISQNRRRRWRDNDVFEEIFAEIVRKCMSAGLVAGSLILTDSTHVKANAGMDKTEVVIITRTPREYIKQLDALCEAEDVRRRLEDIEKGRKKRGKSADPSPKTQAITKSLTDPESGLLNRPGKPIGFHYLSHQSVDGDSGIITDVHVTPANTEDFEPYVDRIRYQINTYNFPVREVGIDRGYDRTEVHKGMYDLGIKSYTPIVDTEKTTRSRVFPPSVFDYNEESDVFICPNSRELKYSHVDKSKRVKIYRAKTNECRECPLRDQCIGGTAERPRSLKISFFRKEVECQRKNSYTPRYYEIQRRRRVYCEGNFAIQKDNYNLRCTRKRGNAAVTEHCFCSAMALNLKRLVKYLKEQTNVPLFPHSKELHPLGSFPSGCLLENRLLSTSPRCRGPFGCVLNTRGSRTAG